MSAMSLEDRIASLERRVAQLEAERPNRLGPPSVPVDRDPPWWPYAEPMPFKNPPVVYDPCEACERNGGICGNAACPKRLVVTYAAQALPVVGPTAI